MRVNRGGRIAVIVIVFMIFCVLGMNLMNVMAENPSGSPYQKYYTSIQIQSGDTLWTIAARCKPHSGKTTEEVVRELKNINSLGGDIIHAGNYLTIPYYTLGEDEDAGEKSAGRIEGEH